MDNPLTMTGEQQLTELAEQFDAWRMTKASRSARIPERLWTEALKLCEQLPRSQVQRRLRLSSRDIRKRQGLEVPPRQRAKTAPVAIQATSFVEVTEAVSPSTSTVLSGAELVVERADGARLQLRYSGAVSELTPLVHSFWVSR